MDWRIKLKIDISKFRINKKPENEVSEWTPFSSRRVFKDATKTEFVFNEDGPYSERIFGRIGKCKCKTFPRTKPGMCNVCGAKIVDRGNIPDYYIHCPIRIPFQGTRYEDLSDKKKEIEDIKNIMEFKALYVSTGFIEYDGTSEKNYTPTEEDEKPGGIVFGEEALIRYCKENDIYLPDDWYEDNTIEDICIPHPLYRPIIKTFGSKTSYKIDPITESLQEMLKASEKMGIYSNLESSKDGIIIDNQWLKYINSRLYYDEYIKYKNNIIGLMFGNKNNIRKLEIIAQKISGAVRGVLNNRYGIPEDEIRIPPVFVRTLWPHLYKMYNGDMHKIDEHLRNEELYVMLNRQPTIGQKSIYCMKPRIEFDEDYKYVIGIDPILFDGIAGDVDGDVIFLAAVYSDAANREIKVLLPSVNYRSAESGKVRNKIPEDMMYVMDRIYLENKEEKKILMEMFGGNGEIEHDKKYLDQCVKRDKYIEVYHYLSSFMWKYNQIPTIGDIMDFIDGKENKIFNYSMEYTGNTEKIGKLLHKENKKYNQEESIKHMKEVIAANSTDITESGWLYKKIMASCDDIHISQDDCGCSGELIENIDEETYNHKIRNMWVEELNDYSDETWFDFSKRGIKSCHIHSPMTCKDMKRRCICKKCAGHVILGSPDKHFETNRFGIFATLMVTEFATQGSLDSMNKGTTVNVNVLLEEKIDCGSKGMTWDQCLELTSIVCDKIGYIGIQRRFFEIVYLSRFHHYKDDRYIPTSIKESISKQNDPLSIFIFQPTERNFNKMIMAGNFESNSVKTEIMFDFYKKK